LGWARWGGTWAVAGQESLAQASGSLELANGGLRALGKARKANFTFQRNLSIYAVLGVRSAGWAGLRILTGRRGQSHARGSRELANGGLRALGEARKANFTQFLECGALGWLGKPQGFSWSQARGSPELASVD